MIILLENAFYFFSRETLFPPLQKYVSGIICWVTNTFFFSDLLWSKWTLFLMVEELAIHITWMFDRLSSIPVQWNIFANTKPKIQEDVPHDKTTSEMQEHHLPPF